MKASAEFIEHWRQHPESRYELIARVSLDTAEAAARLSAHGVEVRRQLRIIESLAVSCSGAQALWLLEEPWVVRIQPNAPVRAA